ncbi:helix-turn-helix transcriptional regulator [Hydrogenibacillus schlegelii]|uniref:HTH luxR-type domain-containing protein n=1 Tax=Hydrogenibacillus schlegelii TaxID=1484 RepID=A0A132NES2_HYDSH|nr:helix-turn-helix transcriptional regulator [Hydrogenibacillus schlegelii]KWX08611.1 hypothetical protein TR75_00405 [Hydrogenibacillus schlegelii]OAR03958.1 hypothetical protein SA87_00885 [Hydrogenibacillus schlegelii]
MGLFFSTYRYPYGYAIWLIEEVLELLAAGASTGEIARKLHLSRSTIKTHLARIAEKLGIEPGVKSILMFIDRFTR